MRALHRVLLAAAVLLLPGVASAEWQLAVDANAIFPTGELDNGTGFGMDGRLGYILPIPGYLVPEVEVGFVDFAEPDNNDPSVSAWRALAGVRLGVGTILRPHVFGHIGYGNISVEEPNDDFFDGRNPLTDDSAFAWDAGVGIDVTILPILDIGVQGAYNRVETDEAVKWWSAGGHVALLF